ncbi:MAG: ABC transporter ATP-binding protein [Candidatus Omnitrophica bacterium]|nr:ABC transporter ATP-binding protein [Candidatus Omnitrophota bacterium]
MPILRAESIFKSYTDTQKRVEVLKGIDLDISAGETVAIVGPSGAGKSTLLHVLGGLDVPDRGRVSLAGQDVYSLNDVQRSQMRNRDVGFVFQFYHLLPELNSLENVMLPMLISAGGRGKKRELESRARTALEQVGLADRLDHKPNQLSGGEQQRVAIARALMNEPRVLLCDEPTGNLDSQTGGAVIETLLSLGRRQGRTLVIVTHDEAIAKRCSRIVPIRDGFLEQKH